MKQFSLTCLLLLAALVAALITVGVTYRDNSRLKSEIAEWRESADSYEHMLETRDKNLGDARIGTSLLYRMAILDDKYSDLFGFLNTIPPESLSCSVMEFPELPSVRIFSYFQNRQCADGTILPMAECKSAKIMVENKSLEIVDYVMHNGFGGMSQDLDDHWTTDWELPDGTTVEYKIFPTGFERMR